MGLLDWFKQVYHQGPQNPANNQAKTPYFHMPEGRPKTPERHNLQQDLIDAIRMSGKDQNPEMINALIQHVESLAGIKTFAAADPFLEGVFRKRKFDIRNVLEGFFMKDENERYLPKEDWSSISSGELPLEIQEFVNSVLRNVEKLWLEREFKEIGTVKAIGPDGKVREFEKDKVPQDHKVMPEEPQVAPQPVVTEQPPTPPAPPPPPTPAPEPQPPPVTVEQPKSDAVDIPLKESPAVQPNIPKAVPKLKVRRRKSLY